MTWYLFFKSVHVLAAVVWVGGALMIQLFALRALAAPNKARQAEFSADAEWVGMRVFIPTTIVLLLAAVGVMQNGHWSWSTLWVDFALVVFFASFAVGAGFLGPESGRLAVIIEAEGPESPNALARIRRILLISRIECVFLFGVIWDMVVKPTGDTLGWAVAAAAVMAAAIALLVRSYRSAAAAPEAVAATTT
jgi:uncharacterized membrane protein